MCISTGRILVKGSKMSHKYGLKGHVRIIYGLKNLKLEPDILHTGLKGTLTDTNKNL